MSTGALWVLGAPGPEMDEIERMLDRRGERVVHARIGEGHASRRPANEEEARSVNGWKIRDGERPLNPVPETVYLVGCWSARDEDGPYLEGLYFAVRSARAVLNSRHFPIKPRRP